MTLVGRLVRGVLKLGLLGALAAGGVWAYQHWDVSDGSDRSTPAAIDYNCGLPGCGRPWLMQAMGDPYRYSTWVDGEKVWITSPPPVAGTDQYAIEGWFWVMPIEDYSMVYLPVSTNGDGTVRSWDEVYSVVCSVHPQLGDGDVSPMNAADLAAAGRDGEDWYSDGGRLDYHLPPLAQATLDYMTVDGESGACGAATSGGTAAGTTRPQSTSTQPATQRWRVSLIGYEIDEMDPYWRITTGVRGAIRFDYDLLAEIVLRRDGSTWVFDSASVTSARVRVSNEYGPPGTWEFRSDPPQCRDCGTYRPGRTLGGDVDGATVRIGWGPFRPQVRMEARISVSCTPAPACSRWGERWYTSETFIDRASGEYLPLTDGWFREFDVVDTEDRRWVHFTYAVSRVDG